MERIATVNEYHAIKRGKKRKKTTELMKRKRRIQFIDTSSEFVSYSSKGIQFRYFLVNNKKLRNSISNAKVKKIGDCGFNCNDSELTSAIS